MLVFASIYRVHVRLEFQKRVPIFYLSFAHFIFQTGLDRLAGRGQGWRGWVVV